MCNSHPNYIGEILYNLRRERKKTQEQLAEDSGLACRTIQDLEANRKHPRIGTINALAHALDLHPVEFFRLIHEYYSQNKHSSLPAESEEGDNS